MPKPQSKAPGTSARKKVKVPAEVPFGVTEDLAVTKPAGGSAGPSNDNPLAAIDKVDTRYLQTLMGYNARRAALSIIELFLERLAPYGLKPVDFSVMSTIQHNPGVTSRQLCATLNLLPPNLVGLIQSLESRGLIERKPHPHDGRAVGLHASPKGQALMVQAEQAASELEIEKTAKLTPSQRKTLLVLLQKIYL